MSPVSRGRKSKKSKKGKKRPASAPGSARISPAEAAQLGGLTIGEPRSPLNALFEAMSERDEPEWWKQAYQRVIDASAGLLACQSPRELEQATAELIGAVFYDAVREEQSGLRFDVWATQLIGQVVDHIADAAGRGDDAWQGSWWLLHGLSSIGSPGFAGFVWEQTSQAANSVPSAALAAQPAWLKLMPDIKATGDVQVMRDAYGTRFGVIAGFCYPGGVDPSVYLFDVDVCGSIGLARAGVFDDVAQAAAAWRAWVGVSADGLVPIPATAESLTCLVYCESGEDIVNGDESRELMDNYFRGPRRMHDVFESLRKQSFGLPPYRSLYDDIDVAPMTVPFTTWYRERHDHEPDQEAVETLAEQWLEGMLPGTEHAVSPHRSEYHRELIADWMDDPVTDAALPLLPEWVRWNGEQSHLPAPLIDRAVSAASD